MYAIYSNGVMLSITDSPRYVRLNESSGAYVEAAPDEAVGIAVSGTLYNLPGDVYKRQADSFPGNGGDRKWLI